MSSFSPGPRVTSRRERSHAPTASTHDCGSPTQWQGRTDSGSFCPGSPPAGSVLPHIPRPHRCTGTAALLLAPEKRRQPRPRVHASLLQWHPLLLSARPPARLAHLSAHARANRPPAPSHPPCGGGPAAPRVRHSLAPPGLLHHRLQRGTPAACSPLPAGLCHRWPASSGPCPSWHGRHRPGRPPARRDPRAAASLLANPSSSDLALSRHRAGSPPKSSGGFSQASEQCPRGLPHSHTPCRHDHNRRGPPSPAACLRPPSPCSRRASPAPPALLGPSPTRNHAGLPPSHPHRACRGLRAPPCPQARAPAMTTLRDSCTACAPAYLERSPPLPLAHRQVLSAIHQCHSGHSGHRLSQCHSGGAHHRVHHACGHRHCPPCQQHTSQQWLQHHLERPLPGPPLLRPFPVPETLRPFLRAPHRLADHALFTASSLARTRLATADRCIGTDLPGFLGVLHPWGRQLPYHPHLHSSVPGGGLAQDRTTWRPSRAHCCVPVKALSPIDRALCKEDRRHAGLLEHITPQVWTLPWNVQSQAPPHGHAACTSRAPSVFRGAIAHPRLVRRQDRTVTCTSRTVGRTRPRTTDLDGMEFLRRFLQHVVPDGCMTVRPCGLLHARCALPPDPLRLMLVQAHPMACTPMPSVSPAPLATRCPTCGAPMRRVRRLWTSHRALVETS